MQKSFSKIAAPFLTACALAACSAAPKTAANDPKPDPNQLLEGMVSFAMITAASQGYEVGAGCRNNNRAGFTAWSPEKNEYQLVLAQDNTMRGTVIKAEDTTYAALQKRLNEHCFPKP